MEKRDWRLYIDRGLERKHVANDLTSPGHRRPYPRHPVEGFLINVDLRSL